MIHTVVHTYCSYSFSALSMVMRERNSWRAISDLRGHPARLQSYGLDAARSTDHVRQQNIRDTRSKKCKVGYCILCERGQYRLSFVLAWLNDRRLVFEYSRSAIGYASRCGAIDLMGARWCDFLAISTGARSRYACPMQSVTQVTKCRLLAALR